MVENAPHSKAQYWMILASLFASVLTFGIGFGGLVPWIALVLDQQGTDSTLIGIVSAANPVGVLLAAPFVPRIVQKFGAADAMIASGVIALLAIAFLPVFSSVPAWIALRLISGLAGSVSWVVTETWINSLAEDRIRGRLVSLYVATMASGFATGPIVVTLVGTDSQVAIASFVVLHLVAILPIILIRRFAPRLNITGSTKLSRIALAMPVLLAAAFFAGTVDTAFFTFLPIWGIRTGLDETYAVTLLSVFVAGNIFLQFPLGWIADLIGYRLAMIGCGVVCMLSPVLTISALHTPFILGAVMFAWGGAAWGLYAIGLTALGHRFKGERLTAANSAFVIVYTLANIAGPPSAGLAIKLWNPHGLIALMLGVAVAFTLLVLWRNLRGASV